MIDPLLEPPREGRGIDGAAARRHRRGLSAVLEAIQGKLLGIEWIMAWV